MLRISQEFFKPIETILFEKKKKKQPQNENTSALNIIWSSHAEVWTTATVVLQGWKNFSLDTRDFAVCSGLLPSSSSSSNIQNGLLKKNRCFLKDGFIYQLNTLTRNVCEFPSPGICHNSTSSSEKHRDKKAWFLWYNLSRILHCTSSDFPLRASFLVRGLPTFQVAVSTDSWTLVHTPVRAALGFASAQHFGPWEYELQWGKSNNQIHGQPLCSLIRLGSIFNPYPLARAMKSMPVSAHGGKFLLSLLQVCSGLHI